jgi:Domain of unknown function (DUF5916)/Carbohydrate family 9 binding domain-like
LPKFYFLFLYLLVASSGNAQDIELSKYKDVFQLPIKKATGTIKVDGDLNETDWEVAGVATDFWLKFPIDNAKAGHKTIAKLTYDEKSLYVGFIVYDSMPLIGQSLKRDTRIRENDGAGIMLDPIGKKTNGFYFTVTAYNVQADDLLTVNNESLSFSWDNKWYSSVKHFAGHYTIEMAIPFKTLRYDGSNTTWGINFIRSDRKKNEIHTWTRVPVNFPGVDLGYLGALKWDAAPPKPGSNISIIPYTTGGLAENKEAGQKLKGDIDAGFDAKIALTSSLNLDLTVNPDFSQVEVDRQVTNLSRFSIFFPERRNFFLENSDLFSEYGIPPIRPFYSRRIGLDKTGNPIPIIGGARLTGNVASRTRIGLMSMQTKATDDFAAQNYTAFTLQQQLLKRTTFKTYFFNRQAFSNEKHDLKDPLDKYGRNAGGELYYVNEKGDWQGWLGYHHSMKSGLKDKNIFFGYGGGYFGRKLTSFIDYDGVGNNYHTDIGFVQRIENYDALNDTIIRLGFKQVYNENKYNFFPKKGSINQHTIGLENFFVFNRDGSFNERENELSYTAQFKNTGNIEIQIQNNETNLLFHTSFTEATPLPPGKYKYTQYGAGYESDNRKNLSFGAGFSAGKFYTADFLELSGGVIFRSQPWLTVELNAQYNKLSFPDPYGKESLFLLANRVEINFSNKIFWTTFLQYNTQANNFNINSRLQWRYKPASDLFLVYTDNYFSDPFLKNKSRSIVFKLNYWLNL